MPDQSISCPALLVTAPASGQGKTTVTAAIASYHRRRGRRVRCFKIGPDFIDPMILTEASGNPVYQLDVWMAGEERCRQLVFQAAATADVLLFEGMMGLYDGPNGSADIADRFNIPILPVIDARAMGQTFGAIVLGLVSYRKELTFAGVVANNVASARHRDMLEESLQTPALKQLLQTQFAKQEVTTPFLALSKNPDYTLPERHLGLCLAREVPDLQRRLDSLADAVEDTPLATLPPATRFTGTASAELPSLAGVRIAIAKDDAFSFIYVANIELLTAMGATVVYFSPLLDTSVPDVDVIYLPGGYPELHAEALSNNVPMHNALKRHVNSQKVLVAECGGMMFLSRQLTDFDKHCYPMAGLLDISIAMQEKVQAIGPQLFDWQGVQLRGHTFHYSSIVDEPCTDNLATYMTTSPRQRAGEKVFIRDGIIASYMHWYLPGNPRAAADMFSGRWRN